DYFWGRGGVHHPWGLGVPILATPFHAVARLLGKPGFPDTVFFLILYALVAYVLSRGLDRSSPRSGPATSLAASAAAGFVMIFPSFVGMLAARFWVFEETIAVGALWSLLLLAALLELFKDCSRRRLILACALSGFAALIRPPAGVYGLATALLAL